MTDTNAWCPGCCSSVTSAEKVFSDARRSQELNRQDARARLIELIVQAAHRPKARKATRPTYSSKLKRLETKSKRSGVKTMRGRPKGDD